MGAPVLLPSSLLLAAIVAGLAVLDCFRSPHFIPGSEPTPVPDETHLVKDAIIAKKEADAALAAAQIAADVATASLVIDLQSSGSVVLIDTAHPGTFEIWRLDTGHACGVSSFKVVDAAETKVPGPAPVPVIPPPTADNMAALAKLQSELDASLASPEVPPSPPA